MSDNKKRIPKILTKAWIAKELQLATSFELKREGVFTPAWIAMLGIKDYDTKKKFTLDESIRIKAMLKYREYID